MIFDSKSAISSSYERPSRDGAAGNCFAMSPGCTRESTSYESMLSRYDAIQSISLWPASRNSPEVASSFGMRAIFFRRHRLCKSEHRRNERGDENLARQSRPRSFDVPVDAIGHAEIDREIRRELQQNDGDDQTLSPARRSSRDGECKDDREPHPPVGERLQQRHRDLTGSRSSLRRACDERALCKIRFQREDRFHGHPWRGDGQRRPEAQDAAALEAQQRGGRAAALPAPPRP